MKRSDLSEKQIGFFDFIPSAGKIEVFKQVDKNTLSSFERFAELCAYKNEEWTKAHIEDVLDIECGVDLLEDNVYEEYGWEGYQSYFLQPVIKEKVRPINTKMEPLRYEDLNDGQKKLIDLVFGKKIKKDFLKYLETVPPFADWRNYGTFEVSYANFIASVSNQIKHPISDYGLEGRPTLYEIKAENNDHGYDIVFFDVEAENIPLSCRDKKRPARPLNKENEIKEDKKAWERMEAIWENASDKEKDYQKYPFHHTAIFGLLLAIASVLFIGFGLIGLLAAKHQNALPTTIISLIVAAIAMTLSITGQTRSLTKAPGTCGIIFSAITIVTGVLHIILTSI